MTSETNKGSRCQCHSLVHAAHFQRTFLPLISFSSPSVRAATLTLAFELHAENILWSPHATYGSLWAVCSKWGHQMNHRREKEDAKHMSWVKGDLWTRLKAKRCLYLEKSSLMRQSECKLQPWLGIVYFQLISAPELSEIHYCAHRNPSYLS